MSLYRSNRDGLMIHLVYSLVRILEMNLSVRIIDRGFQDHYSEDNLNRITRGVIKLR